MKSEPSDWFGFFVLETWEILPAQATVVMVDEYIAGQGE
jgi:hypothetical protein